MRTPIRPLPPLFGVSRSLSGSFGLSTPCHATCAELRDAWMWFDQRLPPDAAITSTCVSVGLASCHPRDLSIEGSTIRGVRVFHDTLNIERYRTRFGGSRFAIGYSRTTSVVFSSSNPRPNLWRLCRSSLLNKPLARKRAQEASPKKRAKDRLSHSSS